MAGYEAIHIGIQGSVIALDPSTGAELWKTALKGTSFVNVTLKVNKVIAATRGELFGLDPASGRILWNNKLKGLGTGFVTIAGAAQVPAISAMYQQQQNDAGATAAAAG